MVKNSELKRNRHGRLLQCPYILKISKTGIHDSLCCGERLKGKYHEEEQTMKYESFCSKHTSTKFNDDDDDVPVDQPVVTVTPKQIRVLRMVLDDLFPTRNGKEWTENIHKRKDYVTKHPLSRRLLLEGSDHSKNKYKFIVNTLASTLETTEDVIKILGVK